MFDGIDAYTDAMIGFVRSVEDEERSPRPHARHRALHRRRRLDPEGRASWATARWKELLERQNGTVRAMLARYRGTEVKTTGDGFLATFDGPARAVKCAQAICEAVRPLGLEVRAGCHTGEIELMGADVGGIAVHIGARVAALAGPSEVLVSSTVKDLVAGSGLVFEDRGEQTSRAYPTSGTCTRSRIDECIGRDRGESGAEGRRGDITSAGNEAKREADLGVTTATGPNRGREQR